ncbi:MAG: non-homologous end-joining DNA ligase [Candidatus Dormibacteria bacterium]
MSPSADPLSEYRRKRSFDRTAEPEGGKIRADPLPLSRFVVQKHRASHLHYDLRLEIDGVLVSWAVPRGPSLDPAVRRLAMHVEDHPVEYFDFEGTIPRGEYGGGTVMVWDWGGARWLGDDPAAMLAQGDLKFELFGRKLKGAFAIVQGSRDEKQWLLIKKRDEAARPGYEVVAEELSVISGRNLDEISRGAGRTWHSTRPASEQVDHRGSLLEIPGARRSVLPPLPEPMLATPARVPFSDPAWTFELKLDGFRTMAQVKGGVVRLFSRRGLDATRQFSELGCLAVLVRAREAVLDGEVVALDDEGRFSFGRLQQRTGWKGGPTAVAAHPSIPIVYYVFDILYLDGVSLLDVALVERRRLLTATLLEGPWVRQVEGFGGEDGELLFAAVKAQGHEGIVGKRLDSKYRPAERSRAWVKLKSNREQSCVIVGWTAPQGGRKFFGSLALAVVDASGQLRYAGQVGSGFDEKLLASISSAMKSISIEAPASGMSNLAVASAGTTWVQPLLVCDVKFNEWTREKLLRQATFLRMREDLVVEDCAVTDL